MIDASPEADTSRTESGAVATAATSRRHTERAIHILVGAVLTLFFLSSYIATLAPTVLWGDSGSFQTRAYILGIPHPTGYPTFTMLGKLFSFIPTGDVAYRVNLSSAVYAAGSVLLLYLILLRFTSTLPALVAAAAFGASADFWSQAVIAEVYTLNTLLLGGSVLALLTWRESRKDAYLLVAAFLTGLSMTNHLTSGLLIPAGLLFVWLTSGKSLLRWRLLGGVLVSYLLGLLPYLYLPIRLWRYYSTVPPRAEFMDPSYVRSSMHLFNKLPASDFLGPDYVAPSILESFLYLVTGRQFAKQMWQFGPSELPQRLGLYWGFLREQYNPILLALAFLGLMYGLRHYRAISALLATLYLGQLVYTLEYDVPDVNLFFIPAHLVVAIWIGFGIQALLMPLGSVRAFKMPEPERLLLVLALLLVCGYTWRANIQRVDQSDNYAARQNIEVMARAPGGPVVYSSWYTGTTLAYLKLVEGRCGACDVFTVDGLNLEPLLQRDLSAGRPIYLTNSIVADRLRADYDLREVAPRLWRIERAREGSR